MVNSSTPTTSSVRELLRVGLALSKATAQSKSYSMLSYPTLSSQLPLQCRIQFHLHSSPRSLPRRELDQLDSCQGIGRLGYHRQPIRIHQHLRRTYCAREDEEPIHLCLCRLGSHRDGDLVVLWCGDCWEDHRRVGIIGSVLGLSDDTNS